MLFQLASLETLGASSSATYQAQYLSLAARNVAEVLSWADFTGHEYSEALCARALVAWGEQHLLRFVSRPSQSRRTHGPAQVTSLTYRTGEKRATAAHEWPLRRVRERLDHGNAQASEKGKRSERVSSKHRSHGFQTSSQLFCQPSLLAAPPYRARPPTRQGDARPSLHTAFLPTAPKPKPSAISPLLTQSERRSTDTPLPPSRSDVSDPSVVRWRRQPLRMRFWRVPPRRAAAQAGRGITHEAAPVPWDARSGDLRDCVGEMTASE